MKKQHAKKVLRELISRGWKINESDGTVTNPKTGRKIKIKTALGYGQDHPAYAAAARVAKLDKDNPTDSRTGTQQAAIDYINVDGDGKIDYDKMESNISNMSDEEAKTQYNTIKKANKIMQTSKQKRDNASQEIDRSVNRARREGFGVSGEPELEEVQALLDKRDEQSERAAMDKWVEYSENNPDSEFAMSNNDIAAYRKNTRDLDASQKTMDKVSDRYGIDRPNDFQRLEDAMYDTIQQEKGFDPNEDETNEILERLSEIRYRNLRWLKESKKTSLKNLLRKRR